MENGKSKLRGFVGDHMREDHGENIELVAKLDEHSWVPLVVSPSVGPNQLAQHPF
jgi:hypothetical protein